ncbi:MAG: 4-hydroxy-3-methylbut-2-enyl diphosphate reductase [Campylobacteraceae bacterium]|jgi:4-hydroxy-3-methylbut-2-enyl diphosphate reductase|nr:4-hydroxy-3-methylbut-2-enyl diphosphate reductase [Campylobacteraceae bacterium]
MEIKLAQNYGFCFGVKRAIKIAESARGASTIGPLIHNNEEILRLKENFDITTLQSIDDAASIKKAIIRTHGIPKDDLEYLKSKNIEIVDATCPFVTKLQKICEKMSKDGYSVVIFGDENHPEVQSVKSYAENSVVVILSCEDLESLNLSKKVALVSQTTRKFEEFVKIANHLIYTHKEVRVFNTICNATLENQKSTKTLAKEVDVMIVVGGKNSSNTKQVYAISKEFCEDSYLIENENELKKEWFFEKKICGITAGASTPDWIIKKTIEKISNFKV